MDGIKKLEAWNNLRLRIKLSVNNAYACATVTDLQWWRVILSVFNYNYRTVLKKKAYTFWRNQGWDYVNIQNESASWFAWPQLFPDSLSYNLRLNNKERGSMICVPYKLNTSGKNFFRTLLRAFHIAVTTLHLPRHIQLSLSIYTYIDSGWRTVF